MKKYRMGIIGAGVIAFEDSVDKTHEYWVAPSYPSTHFHSFSTMNEIELVAVADINQDALKKVQDTFGLRTYSNYMEMISTEKLDIVSVATPVATHKMILKELLGTPLLGIFCEKPLVDNLADAKELAQAFSKSSIKVVVDIYRNYDALHLKVLKMVQEGKIGALDTMFFQWEETGIQECGTHAIGLSHLFASPLSPKRVLCATNQDAPGEPYGTDESGSIMLEYENNVRSMIWVPKRGVRHMDEAKFIGSEGYIRVGKYVSEHVQWEQYGKRIYDVLPVVKPLPTRSFGKSPLQNGMKALLDAIEKNSQPHTGIPEALNVLEVVVASLVSSKEKKWVDFPLDSKYDSLRIY